jgi:uncharacterized protein YidB (DUF937 family)
LWKNAAHKAGRDISKETRRMATFDQLIQEIDKRYSLGTNACPLVQETFRLITGLPGGIEGLLDRFKAAGFTVEVASWSDGSDPVPLTGEEVERTLGLGAITGIANTIGITQNFARTILGYAIPEIILLARKGAVPPAAPAATSAFARPPSPLSAPPAEDPSQPEIEQEERRAASGFDAALRRIPLFKWLATRRSRMALAVCVLGFAFAAGWYSSPRSPSLNGAEPSARTAAPQIAEDIRALKANVETLRQAQSHSERDAAAFGNLKARLDALQSETAAAVSTVAGKLEQIQRDSEVKLSQLAGRLDRIEHQIAMPPAAAKPGVSAPPLDYARRNRGIRGGSDAFDRSQNRAALGPRRGSPKLITNWAVRDVYDGVALVESPRGSIEVTPGDILPGAGVVLSIERRGPGWIVITSRGLVDSSP